MGQVGADDRKPLLIYDGDCGFCNFWIQYWKKLTGERVSYAPYQEAAAQYPQIPVEKFQKAIQYVAPDGKISSAAEASFLTLSNASGKCFWLKLYRKLPGFAAISERVYAFIAAHRPVFYRLSLILWGKNYSPPQYDLVSSLFLRCLGLIYLSAFASFGVQAMGLIGSQGISPLSDMVNFVSNHLGVERYWRLPMVFWLDASDFTIKAVCWAGVALSLCLTLGIMTRVNLILLYVLYLSLLYGGQEFMTYQWDIFLVETGFLAILLSISTWPGLFLLRWLIFRFMFMSGAVKLLSGDPNWANLTALSYHFLTQPLPTPLAWYASHIPSGILVFTTGLVFVIELVLPFFIFCPRRMRFVAAFGMLFLEMCIFLTGNYNFFNLQTMLLCLPLFDDAALQKIIPERFCKLKNAKEKKASKFTAYVLTSIAILIVFCSLVQMSEHFGYKPPDTALEIDQSLEPLRIINSYGLFAVMTTKRDEIILEGSDDGKEWKEYTFKYKPGDVNHPPLWNIPHQPRLDWQMWFAALQSPKHLPWFAHFLRRVLENSPPVMALMERNPFPDKPPVYVRAMFYDYTYASPEDKEKGIWWNRKLLGIYFPPASLTKH